ncbi:hypothetical protein XELAEV_18013230mg [Xenopus laevis]|uniref:Helix-turn-helix domain-containing protein n=1 Tax=Xenopus laevis TaxID=8355 RepID=A0A974DP50_XENLA|nr:hypothetical protein XELAEV_18013230mg [Xenopus laevis]
MFQLDIDLYCFFHSLRLKVYSFHKPQEPLVTNENKNTLNTETFGLYGRSMCVPPTSYAAVETYINNIINQILHYTSQHPPHTKKSTPISQLSRVQRIVSEKQEKEKQEQIMCHKFRARGYPEKVIQQAQQKVAHPRDRVRQSNRTTFVTQFHGKTIGAHVTSSLMKTKLKDVHTFWGGKSKGKFPCLGCVQCPYVLKGREFVHPQIGQHIQLRGHYTCICKFAVYLCKCPCGLIYIGETTQMVKELKLKRREVWWINTLKSLHPLGLNRDYDLFLYQ